MALANHAENTLQMYCNELKKGEKLEGFNVGNALNVRISAEYSNLNEDPKNDESISNLALILPEFPYFLAVFYAQFHFMLSFHCIF